VGEIIDHVAAEALRQLSNELRDRRDAVLQNWVQRVAREPFHLGRPERAVADHIPRLLDALIEDLAGSPAERERAEQELAAIGLEHARARLVQGLSTSEVLTELRILAQEIGAELRTSVDTEPMRLSDVLGAEVLINDRLFAAAVAAADVMGEELRRQRTDAAKLIVHDLRTPLTSLKGFAELLSRNPGSDFAANAAKMILEQTARLTSLIDQFLGSSQADHQIPALQPGHVDLRELIEEVVRSLGGEARRRIKVSVQSGTTPEGMWDGAQLKRVLENVLGNALKYAPTGDVDVTVGVQDERLFIRVHDEGIGVAPEDQTKILEPYFRSPDAINRNVEGTGLGLFIARGIVEAHSGTLTVESPGTGQGTTVTITLPPHLEDEQPVPS